MTRIRTAILLAVSCPVLIGNVSAQDDYRAKAFAASDAGDFERAAELFYRLFKAGADDKEVLGAGAKSLEKTGRYNDALGVLQRGAKKFPREATFRVGLARVLNLKAAQTYQESGKLDSHVVFNYQDAIREAKRALKTWPKNRDARLILANSHYSIGEWDKAKKQADELVERFPEHPGGFIIMGDLAFHHYKLLRKRASGENPDTSEKTQQKILGAREAAKQNFEKALKLDPKRVIAHTKLGDVHAWSGENKAAVQRYRDALQLEPTARVDHTWLRKQMNADELFAFYEKLGQDYLAQPNSQKKKVAIYMWYGAAALVAHKKFDLGEELYMLALQHDPSFTSSYYHAMYCAYFYRKDKEKALVYAAKYAEANAIEFADIVRALPQKDRGELTQLVKYFAKQAMDKGVPSASRDLNHVLAAIVDTSDAWNNFAFMARESGQFDKSEKAYRSALAIQPHSGQLMNDLAVILHYHKGEDAHLEEAEKLYKAAVVAAKKQLRKSKATKEEKARAKKTLSDASANLVKLKEVQKHRAATKSKSKASKKK